jgi:hypothetical protein
MVMLDLSESDRIQGLEKDVATYAQVITPSRIEPA